MASRYPGGTNSRNVTMKYKQPILWAALCLAVGMAAGALQADSLKEWDPYLNKPGLTPPDWAFPVAWTILYVLMGFSIGLARNSSHPGRKALTGVFLAQLAVNFLWSMAFFVMRSPAARLGLISVLFLLLLIYAWKSRPINRISAYLFVPYILWVGFAWYLNFSIFLQN